MYNFKEPTNRSHPIATDMPRATLISAHKYLWVHSAHKYAYGVATLRRLLKIKGLFCRISSLS